MSGNSIQQVHVVGTSIPFVERRPNLGSVYHVVSLMSGDSYQEILPASNKRVIAFVQALDDDVWLSDSKANAQSGAGSVLPKSNGAPWPVIDSGVIWASNTSGSFNGPGGVSRVVVVATYRE